MVFLPGDHVLDRTITVTNVARLTMHGESSSDIIATVVRNGSVGFYFTNMVDFNIDSLAFTSYNRSWSYGSHPASNFALLLQSTRNAKLVNCSFHDNLGTALTVHNTSTTLEGISKFIHNQCACQSFSDSEAHARDIAALNSNLTIIGFFHENTQTTFSSLYCGGAIWASDSSLHFNGTNNFINNSVNGARDGGGAIYAKNNSSLSFSGVTNFIRNSAEYGGAITTVNNVVVTFHGTNNFIGNKANNDGGGAIMACHNVKLTFHGTNNFVNNSAGFDGGAIYAEDNIVLTFKRTNKFIDNSVESGGAILAKTNSSLSFSGISDFSHNSAGFDGGAINSDTNSSLSFSGNSDFSHNSAWLGGAINTETNTSLSFRGNSHFSHNSAQFGGSIKSDTNSSLSFSGNSHFSHNSALFGGAFFSETNSSLSFSGNSHFSHNSALFGGAFFSETNSSLSFSGNSHFSHNSALFGGAFFSETNSSLSFSGNSHFSHNSALFGGAFFSETNSSLSFSGNSHFSHNSADLNGGAIIAYRSVVLTITGSSNFISNLAIQGGAISAYFNSTLLFDGSISFNNNGDFAGINRDSRGGAIYLFIGSTFSITHDTTVCWENNHANLGGAIYVYDANLLNYCTQIVKPFVPNEKCFFQLSSQNLSNDIDTQLFFNNNSADTAGSVLYGGTIDSCKLTHGLDSGEVFDKLVQYEDDNTTSAISSDPFLVCPCDMNNHPDCNQEMYKTLSVYPGETLQLSVVAIGQRNGTVPALIRSRISTGRLANFQTAQKTTKTCTKLNYTVFSLQNVTLELYANDQCPVFGDEVVLSVEHISNLSTWI